MVSKIRAHRNHQMLSFSEIVKQKITGPGLIDIFRYEAGIFLNHLNRTVISPCGQKFFLFRAKIHLRRGEHRRNRIRMLPSTIMRYKRLFESKAHKTCTISMSPSLIGSEVKLLPHNSSEPTAK